MSEWKLMWNNSPGMEDYVIIREIDYDNNDAIITEFALTPPRHAKLYYALMDWFQDTKRIREHEHAAQLLQQLVDVYVSAQLRHESTDA